METLPPFEHTMAFNQRRRVTQGRASAVVATLGWAATMSLTGCGSISPDASLGAAQLRFVQVSQGAPELDFYVNGAGAAYNLGFASFTSYLPVSPGATSLSVTKAGSGQPVITSQSTFNGGHQYTAIATHGLGSLQERIYPDQDTPAPQGQVAVRVLNEVDGAPAIAVYVVSPGRAEGMPAAVINVGSGAASSYVTVPAGGSYNLTATVAQGALSIPVSSVTVKGASGAVRTVVFAGSVQPGGHGVVAFVLEDADAP